MGYNASDSMGSNKHSVGHLTRREFEILKLTWDGLSAREIGERLSIAAKTVEFHRNNILKKYGARNMLAVIRYALRDGQLKV